MKLFETALKYFWFLGMEWDESSQRYFISFKKMFIPQFLGVICFTTTLIFLIKDAKSFEEYTEALFMCSTAALCTIIYTFFYVKLNEFSAFTKLAKIGFSESKYTSKFKYFYNNFYKIPFCYSEFQGLNVRNQKKYSMKLLNRWKNGVKL